MTIPLHLQSEHPSCVIHVCLQDNDEMQENNETPKPASTQRDGEEEEDNRTAEEGDKSAKDDGREKEGETSSSEEDEGGRLLKEDNGEPDLFKLVVVNSYGSQDVNVLKDDDKPLRLSSTLYFFFCTLSGKN